MRNGSKAPLNGRISFIKPNYEQISYINQKKTKALKTIKLWSLTSRWPVEAIPTSLQLVGGKRIKIKVNVNTKVSLRVSWT